MGLTQVSTDGVKNDAITKVKIPANQIETSEIASGAVTSTQILDNTIVDGDIADATITLSKLEHGTGSNDGKFLRANNGADPSFETVSIPAGTTINGNTDHRIITGTGTANTLQGESTFTHNPSTFDTSIIHNTNNPADLIIQNDSSGTAAGARLTLQSGSNANTGPQLQMICGSHDFSLQVPKAAGNLEFNNNGSLAFLMANDGDFHVVDGDVVISTAGHGIDFSATSDASGGTSELLDDYEEGTFTPNWDGAGGVTFSYNHQFGWYTKIGNTVTFQLYIQGYASTITSGNENNGLALQGLPFTILNHSRYYPSFTIGRTYKFDIEAAERLYAYGDPNTTQSRFIKESDDAAGSLLVAQDLNQNVTVVHLSGVYRTDS